MHTVESVRMQKFRSVYCHLYGDINFNLLDNVIGPQEVFDPTGALPLLVARAYKTVQVAHSSLATQRRFPFRVEMSDDPTALTGTHVRLLDAPALFGMGCLFVMDAVEQALEASPRPGYANLDIFLPDLDAVALQLVSGTPGFVSDLALDIPLLTEEVDYYEALKRRVVAATSMIDGAESARGPRSTEVADRAKSGPSSSIPRHVGADL